MCCSFLRRNQKLLKSPPFKKRHIQKPPTTSPKTFSTKTAVSFLLSISSFFMVNFIKKYSVMYISHTWWLNMIFVHVIEALAKQDVAYSNFFCRNKFFFFCKLEVSAEKCFRNWKWYKMKMKWCGGVIFDSLNTVVILWTALHCLSFFFKLN